MDTLKRMNAAKCRALLIAAPLQDVARISLIPCECAEEIAYGETTKECIPRNTLKSLCTNESITSFALRELNIDSYDSRWGPLDKFCTPCLERIRLTGHMPDNFTAIHAFNGSVPSVTFLEIRASSFLGDVLSCVDRVFPSLQSLVIDSEGYSLDGSPLLELNLFPNLAESLRSLSLRCRSFVVTKKKRKDDCIPKKLLRLESLNFANQNDEDAKHLNDVLDICDLAAIRNFKCHSTMQMRCAGVARKLVNCSHFALGSSIQSADNLSLPWLLAQFLYERPAGSADIVTLMVQPYLPCNPGHGIDLFLEKFGATIRSSSLFLPENPVDTLRLMPRIVKADIDLIDAPNTVHFNDFADVLSRPECETEKITIKPHYAWFFTGQPLKPVLSASLRRLRFDITQLPDRDCYGEISQAFLSGCPRLMTVQLTKQYNNNSSKTQTIKRQW